MTNELLNIDVQLIRVSPGAIEFKEYDNLKEQALELARNIEQVEVTEENIKTSKKLLAAVNKRLKEMDSKRIAVKKEMLEPYNQFETQLKEILGIVKNADNLVRTQVRVLEERERDEKRASLSAIFDKRIKHYSFGEVFNFDSFLKQAHLNKTVSVSAVENEMVDWLEKIDADLKVIQTLPNADAILTEYYDTKDLTTAIKIVNEFEERKKMLNDNLKGSVQNQIKKSYQITLSDEKDLTAVEMFMQLKNIKYTIEKVEF
jgi:hypothetical protein